jgi:hypothetical protein
LWIVPDRRVTIGNVASFDAASETAMRHITGTKRLLTPSELQQLTRELLQDALDREERRLGRRLTVHEAEAVLLKDFEPVLLWHAHTIH